MTDCHPNHHLTLMHMPLLSHLNWKLGPLMYEIKTNNCNFTKSCADAFLLRCLTNFHFQLSWSSVKWPHLSLWRVCHRLGLHSSSKNKKTKKHAMSTCKQTLSFQCLTNFLCIWLDQFGYWCLSSHQLFMHLTTPMWLPFTGIHFHFYLLAQPQSPNVLLQLMTLSDKHGEAFTFKMFWISTYSLSKHGAEVCRNNCILHYCLPITVTVHSCVHN